MIDSNFHCFSQQENQNANKMEYYALLIFTCPYCTGNKGGRMLIVRAIWLEQIVHTSEVYQWDLPYELRIIHRKKNVIARNKGVFYHGSQRCWHWNSNVLYSLLYWACSVRFSSACSIVGKLFKPCSVLV